MQRRLGPRNAGDQERRVHRGHVVRKGIRLLLHVALVRSAELRFVSARLLVTRYCTPPGVGGGDASVAALEARALLDALAIVVARAPARDALDPGALQVTEPEARTIDDGALDLCARQLTVPYLRSGEVRARQHGAFQVAVMELHAGKVGASEVGALQIAVRYLRVRQVGAIEVGADELA